MSATQLNLWELLEDLVNAPPTTSIDPMWIEFDRLINQLQSQSLADQLELAGKAILGCSEVIAARANNTIQVLDDRQKCGVSVKADLFGLLIRQPIDQSQLQGLIQQPGQEFNPHPNYRRSVGSIVQEIPIEQAAIYAVPEAEINSIQGIKDLAGDDDPTAWIAVIQAVLESGSLGLVELARKAELTITQAWMACLLGGFRLEQAEWWGEVTISLID